VFTARRITGPIQALRGVARRLGRGDYQTPVESPAGVAEVSALAESFEAMRRGILAKQADIERQASWDTLTDLPNRTQFIKLLDAALRNPAPLAVIVLNLDRFKPVNDQLGRAHGDRLLRQVADRLRAQVPSGDALLARLGGDEFAIYLRGSRADALTLAHELHLAFAEPVDLERRVQPREVDAPQWLKVDVGASLGIALAPLHHQHPDDLVRMAERAMDLAKHRRDGTLVFEPGMDPRSDYSLSLRSELSRAIQQDELRLFLQPKRSLQQSTDFDGRLPIFAAEALVRWQHPERGMVPPGQFIPFAEETGFVRQLTQWVLRAAARQAAQAQERGLSLLVAVNLSTRDLLEADLLPKLLSMLAEEACEPSWISLEITESAIMDDPQRALETVRALYEAGFKLAIDDFGTGYSSLAYLQKLPVDEVKIDQSFVFDLETSVPNQTIVRSTIQLAHELGKRVVAEGVETEAALRLLQEWGCDEAQGYFIARPMPAERLIEKLVDGALETQR
jgi:diguanylate cyclase (GGDEF)-like protein